MQSRQVWITVHDLVTHGFELARRKTLGEEVCDVVDKVDEVDADLVVLVMVLDELAHVEIVRI